MRRLSTSVVFLVVFLAAAPAAADTVLVSRQSPALGGNPGDLTSRDPSPSADGRHVAFGSDARNLSDSDAEPENAPHTGRSDVYVHDRQTGETVLAGPGGGLESYDPDISADGRFVVFVSAPGAHDPGTVQVRDLVTGALENVGTDSTTIGYAYPQAPPAISDDGRIVVHETDGRDALRVVDRKTRAASIFARVADGRFSGLSISGDGGVIAYTRLRDVGDGREISAYRYERTAKKPRLVARYVTGCCYVGFGIYGTSLSTDGRHLAYVAARTTKPYSLRATVYVRDQRTGKTRKLGRGTDPSIDGRGRTVIFTRRPFEGYPRVLRHDLKRGKTTTLAVGDRGRVSRDGRRVAFVEVTSDPEQIFVTDPGG